MKRFLIIPACVSAFVLTCIAGNIQPILLPLENVYTNASARTTYTSPKCNGFVQCVILTATNSVAALATNDVKIMVLANGCGVDRMITSNNVTGVAGNTVIYPRVNADDVFGVVNSTNHVEEIPLASETLTIKAYSTQTNCNVKAYVIIEQP